MNPNGPILTPEQSWFTDARFGLFLHWGPYALLGHGEWAMHQEQIPVKEYEATAARWTMIRRRPAAEWASLAKAAGMRYVVLTAKHHDGFCLWDSALTAYNSTRLGPRRDLVGEFVEAARGAGLRVGLYYSLMDWHHPDGMDAHTSDAKRTRFLDFTHGCVRELCSNYGRIDVLWFDMPHPFKTAEGWDSRKMSDLARSLQPGILINNRNRLPNDFSISEGDVRAHDRPWEACLTLNGDWGHTVTPPGDWRSVRDILRSLQKVSAAGGNLLLNIGPDASGAIPGPARRRLLDVGQWLHSNGEAVFGASVPAKPALERYHNLGYWTRAGRTGYFWLARAWPGESFAIGGLRTKVRAVRFLHNGRPVSFRQDANRLVFHGLPQANPEPIAGVPVLKIQFASPPHQDLQEDDILS